MLEARDAPADRVHRLEEVGVRAEDARPAVLEDVSELLGRQPEVDRNETAPIWGTA